MELLPEFSNGQDIHIANDFLLGSWECCSYKCTLCVNAKRIEVVVCNRQKSVPGGAVITPTSSCTLFTTLCKAAQAGLSGKLSKKLSP